MTPTSASVHAAAEQLASELSERPTPEFIDELATRYLDAKAKSLTAQAVAATIELEAVAFVKQWGIVPPHAEKSRKLAGKFAELTVTKADTLAINDERVDDLKDALEANGYGNFFLRLFAERKKWEVVEGAEAALKSESLPKRLSEKVLNLWGRCISVKPKKRSLKVVIADPAKPAKRTKKVAK
jgi:hypothetical protein